MEEEANLMPLNGFDKENHLFLQCGLKVIIKCGVVLAVSRVALCRLISTLLDLRTYHQVG